MNTLGHVDVDIFNVDGNFCSISDLDSSGNNFQQGEIDVFEGSDLEVNCVKYKDKGTDQSRPYLRVAEGGDKKGCLG